MIGDGRRVDGSPNLMKICPASPGAVSDIARLLPGQEGTNKESQDYFCPLRVSGITRRHKKGGYLELAPSLPIHAPCHSHFRSARLCLTNQFLLKKKAIEKPMFLCSINATLTVLHFCFGSKKQYEICNSWSLFWSMTIDVYWSRNCLKKNLEI